MIALCLYDCISHDDMLVHVTVTILSLVMPDNFHRLGVVARAGERGSRARNANA